jgi:hypothetical protein
MRRRLLLNNHKVSASILRPAVFAVFVTEGRLLAKAAHLYSGGVNPKVHEVIPNHRRPTFAERQVVLTGTPVVTVAINADRRARPLPQPPCTS